MDSLNLVSYIDDEKLYAYSVSCARSFRAEGTASGAEEAAALRSMMKSVGHCHKLIEQKYDGAAVIPAQCEWLLDNRYMLTREYPSVCQTYKHSGAQRKCRSGLIITELCRALLRAGNGSVSPERCRIFLSGFQSVNVLRRRELTMFPAALRYVIIEAVSQCCTALLSEKADDTLTAELEALFTSLRLLSETDMEQLIDEADICGKVLSKDETYRRMDRETKREYLSRLEAIAERGGRDEYLLAKELIEAAAEKCTHIGFLLYDRKRSDSGGVYALANVFLSLIITLFAAYETGSALFSLLLFLPVSELVKGLIDFILLRIIRPHPLPRMDMSSGIPESGKSICVLSVLLGCCSPMKLEELYLASRREGKYLSFGLLADLPTAKTRISPDDKRLILDAENAVKELNKKYGGGFYLFTRPRSFDGELYSAKERKRGAVIELAKLLCGEESELNVCGDEGRLKGTRYIISLDADTRIYPGSIGELVGAALHPLNTPHIDDALGIVTSGHAIIHPRIETELESACETDFALIFAGAGGSDPYGGLCTELYMDAFDCGGFAGKGLIDAAALLRCTDGRFPENSVLSHDALEGAYLRGAYMSDAEFSDAFPSKPLVWFRRQHRWIRGDWQNLPWIFSPGLRSADRFRLLDSLRRSLIAPMTLTAILFGFFSDSPGLLLSAAAALLCLMQDVFYSLASLWLSGRDKVRIKRHTRLLSGIGGAIVRSLMRLWLLPFEAWVSLSAIMLSLWRMLVSRKKLLQWQTFAQSRSSSALSEHIRSMWAAVVLGVILMAFSPQIIGKASGFMWLLLPIAASALSLPSYSEFPLSGRDRELILTAACDAWKYFEEQSGSEDNFLPPDNFQQHPPVGTAHRTSPTNIGLALSSSAVLGSSGIISREKSLAYISRMLCTLEKMPRCIGHFYNWYDTRTLTPLSPPYISTVDSGNMYVGLLVTAEVLSRWNETELAERFHAIMRDMDFSPLFDRDRELFYICYDTALMKPAGGWYDLMASEAMLTSYIALAKGDIPLRHWRRLSRARLQKDGYRGLASWTGTMFEYLMPAIFLPIYRSSLLYETDRFCVYAQKRRHFPGKPWGISESAFYSFDPSMSYRYKAHGCPALCLKRGQEADMVISPYSSFLALAVEPNAASANLRRLKALGAYGRYGFIEALDFTPNRCRHFNGEAVQCFMAHHLGMSILSAVNILDAGAVRGLFMSCPEMNAFSLLLQEKLPEDGSVIKRDCTDIPERPRQTYSKPWIQRGTAGEDFSALLSNGSYNMCFEACGKSLSASDDVCIYRSDGDSSGLDVRINGKSLFAPEHIAMWEFSESMCSYDCSLENISCTLRRCPAVGVCGEILTLDIRSDSENSADVSLSFQPLLCAERDYDSHPSFWKLGLVTEKTNGGIIIRRLRRNACGELFLCVLSETGMSDESCVLSGTGEITLKAFPVRLSSGAATLSFSICLSRTRLDALDGAERILSSDKQSGSIVSAAAHRLGMSADEVSESMRLVKPICENRLNDAAPKKTLWQFGISGDYPIICCDGRAKEAEQILKSFCLLKCCGLECELVYFTAEQGEYIQPVLKGISRTLSDYALEPLIGTPGGVFVVPQSASELVKTRACIIVGERRELLPKLQTLCPHIGKRGLSAPEYEADKRCFRYYVNNIMSPRTWQHILTNSKLSAFAADFGPAGLWYCNAREMRLIPPPPDCGSEYYAEELCLIADGEAVSLFADSSERPCRVEYAPGFARWIKALDGRSIETTMFIPSGTDVRIITVRGAEGTELKWSICPVMGSGDASSVSIVTEGRLAVITGAESYCEGLRMLVGASSECRFESDFCPAALRVSLVCQRETVLCCGCTDESLFTELLSPDTTHTLLEECVSRWAHMLDRVSLKSGVGALDRYINTWGPYQAIACRIEARSSIYQSGGAIGFRDQLQDCANILLCDSSYLRRQIIECCEHQYIEGDVMHWWHRHPDGDRGVRTRCSDDLLWLVWALCEYCEATGDYELCKLDVCYIESETLSDTEHDRYEAAVLSAEVSSVLEHAKRSLGLVKKRGFGKHSLPMMGSGDWNDALNGIEGESVWLAWFYAHCLHRFAALLNTLGDDSAAKYEAEAERMGCAAEASFNGKWYRRAYFPDGRAVGDLERIDSIAQSFAFFSPYADEGHRRTALREALNRLVDREHSLVKLLTPPYSPDESVVGYITGYGEGYRENGGQYTHGAIWLALAAFRAGLSNEAWEIMSMLLPENHNADIYKAEPFVLPADISAAPGHEGEAGWSWYTGSAGWYFRVITREMLGLKLKGGRLYIRPSLPDAVSSFSLELTDKKGNRHTVEYRDSSVKLDGMTYDGSGIEWMV